MKSIRRLILFILVLLTSSPSSLAESIRIDGTGTNFQFDTARGKILVPGCILEEAHAFRTTWELDPSFYSSGEAFILFEHLRNAKVSPMPKRSLAPCDIYEYAGLELIVRSAADASISARLRFTPRNQDDYPEYQSLVDLEIVYYANRDQPDEEHALMEYQLESYDLWNSIVRYTTAHYEPSMLNDVISIEYHSLQNDPGARAKLSDVPPTLRDKDAIRSIVTQLSEAEALSQNLTALDYIHLRLIRKDGSSIHVYLQDPNAAPGGHFEHAPNSDDLHVYVQIGAKCYRLKKDAIQSALRDAGIPAELMI